MFIHNPRFLPAILVTLAASAPAFAQDEAQKIPTEKPFLWRVEGETPSYLFGTIHVPDERVTNLHAVVNNALENSDAFYMELDLTPQLQQSAAQSMQLPGGKMLKDVISAESHKRLGTLLTTKGLGQLLQMGFHNLQPFPVAMNLQALDFMMDIAMGKKPLDSVLMDRAKMGAKETGGLETLDEQAIWKILSLEEQTKLLDETLDAIDEAAKEGKNPTQELLSLYLKGDLDEMLKFIEAEDEGKEEDELSKKVKKFMFTDRNEKMADRIAEKIKANAANSYFFAVGTAHYAGDGSVIALLEAKGYKITRLSAADADTLWKNPKNKKAEEKTPEPAGSGK